MTPEELSRKRAWLEESNASLGGQSLDDQIQVLETEIAEIEVEIAEVEAEGGGVAADAQMRRF